MASAIAAASSIAAARSSAAVARDSASARRRRTSSASRLAPSASSTMARWVSFALCRHCSSIAFSSVTLASFAASAAVSRLSSSPPGPSRQPSHWYSTCSLQKVPLHATHWRRTLTPVENALNPLPHVWHLVPLVCLYGLDGCCCCGGGGGCCGCCCCCCCADPADTRGLLDADPSSSVPRGMVVMPPSLFTAAAPAPERRSSRFTVGAGASLPPP